MMLNLCCLNLCLMTLRYSFVSSLAILFVTQLHGVLRARHCLAPQLKRPKSCGLCKAATGTYQSPSLPLENSLRGESLSTNVRQVAL